MFGCGSGAGSVLRAVAVAPRREPRRLGAGLLPVEGGSARVSLEVAAGDSVPAISAGCSCLVEGALLLPRAPRRLRGIRAVFVVAGLVASAGAAGVGSGVGAAATAGSGGSSMRAPTDETLLPLLPVRALEAAGAAAFFSFSETNGPPATGSKAPPK